LTSARRLGRGLRRAAALAGVVMLTACGDAGRDADRHAPVTFAILSAEGQAAVEPLWRPLLEDMAQAVGAPVQARFGASYAELVRAMEAGEVQAAWLSPRPAIQVIDSGVAELAARTVDRDGEDSYRSVMITRAGSGHDLNRVLACGRDLRLGLGDAASTSATLAPMTFLFGPRGIDPRTCFASVRSGDYPTNAYAVAVGTLDVAVVNTVTLARLRRQNPQIADQLQEVWRSPPLPEGGVLVRQDLDPAVKEKLRSFLLTYGQGESAQADRQRQVLAALNYSQFRAADAAYLDPVREMIAAQTLAQARVPGDRAARQAAETELRRLRADREVQP